MKIAMIGLRGIPAKDGGVEVVVDSLAPLLSKGDLDITVYVRKHYQNQSGFYNGVRIISLLTIESKHLEAFVHSFISTIHAIWNRYDLIHYHAIGSAFWACIPRLFGIKTLVTIHGLDWKNPKWGRFARFILKLGEIASVRFPNKTSCVSPGISQHLSAKYKKEILYIPNGVPLQENNVKSEVLEKFKIKQYILFVGRLVPVKGIHFLIDAFKMLDSDYQLVIVGRATHTEKYVKFLKVKAGNNKKIIFTGPLFGADKQKLFENASIFVLPSTNEGMSIVVLETLSYGIPCIVSNINSNRDWVRDDEKALAYFFNTEDTQDLNRVLKQVIENMDCAKIKAGKAMDYILKTYDWSRIAEKYKEVYFSINNP